MHRAKIPAIFLFLLITSFCQAQSFWKIKTESGEEILLRIDVNASAKTFTASTREDAIKDIAGFFAYNLAHAAGKLKYPEIVYIEGKINQLRDSLKLNGVFYYTDKKYDFHASISDNNFQGRYTDNRKRVHRLVGFKQTDGRPIQNYAAILDRVVAVSEKYFPNPEWLKTSEWDDFKEAVNELKSKISDDYELGALVMWYSRKFPFSSFDLSKLKVIELKQQRQKYNIQILKPHVGLLASSQFPETLKQMDSLAVALSKQAVTKLILDLRGRSQLMPAQAILAMDYLSSKDFSAGVLLGRKWYSLHSSFGIPAGTRSLPKILPESSQAIKFQNEEGYRLEVISDTKKFAGEIYVLTDSRTKGVAEVLAYVLQREKIAKIAGQKSACQPYYFEKLEVSAEFGLQIPLAVFIDWNGRNLAKAGVIPDIQVEKGNALNYLLKTL